MMHFHNTKTKKLTQSKFSLRNVAGTALFALVATFYASTGAASDDCALVPGCAFEEGYTYSEQSENIIVFESTGEYISFREYASDRTWGLVLDEKSAGTWSCSGTTLTMTSAGADPPIKSEGQLGLNLPVYGEGDALGDYKLIFSRDRRYIIRSVYSRRTGEVCAPPSTEPEPPQEQGDRHTDAITPLATLGQVAPKAITTPTGPDDGKVTALDKTTVDPQQIPGADVAVLYSSDADIFDRLGYAVSLSDDGNVLAVGAPFDLERRRPAPMGSDAQYGALGVTGTVTIYERRAGRWTESERLRPASSDSFDDRLLSGYGGRADKFGYSVSLSADGSVLAVGAPVERGNACPDNGQSGTKADQYKHLGAVYIFERSAGGRWTQRACLKGAGEQAMRWFGRATTLSANGQVLVTTSENTDKFSIFERTGQFWTPRGILAPPADKPRLLNEWHEGSTQSVALNDDGSVIAIGMQAQNTVYVHQRKDREWSLKATLPAPSSEIGRLTSLGLSVSINGAGTRLAASAYEQVQLYRRANRGSKDCPDDCVEKAAAETQYLPFYGAIILYEVGDGGKWSLVSHLRLQPLISKRVMLYSVSALVQMSRDGNTVVAGGLAGTI
ncbi:MAG: hypothetical protein K0U66_03205 [Gammaproteobacteria bacterium]|nr:hypothetical protein [Gammaproteobacteria bacterium]